MAEEAVAAGRTFGEFVIREMIGRGGGGAVWRAEQSALNREAVIKIVHARKSDVAIQRFLREARLASRLDHPYAAHVYAFGAEQDGVLWIAMEYVRGTPLDKLLRVQGKVALDRFVPFFERLCEVVHTAHEQGIVHRDIKPANVMVLSRAGRMLPKLLDLGIARALDTSDAQPLVDANGPAQPSESSQLTQDGAFVGSPFYMAPEQWARAADVDARVDIYALGVLAYETLTGRPPFPDPNPMALARAHMSAPIPSLGDGFPPDLDRVIARMLAKRPADRFAGALECASALRIAAGHEADREGLPDLDEPLRERIVADWPQPLAEAVAMLEAARNAHQARDAVSDILHVVVRYLAVLALASHARIGPGGAGDQPIATRILRSLRQRDFDHLDWLELCRELLRPFVPQRDAHAFPELVGFFHSTDGGESGADLLATLVESTSATEQGSHSDEARVRELLARRLPELARVLRALTFLADYPIVVPRGDRGERWMGLRRRRRVAIALRGGLEPGQPVVLDRASQPVLVLWPLVQVSAPSPGAPEEMFLLEGRGRHGVRFSAPPYGFERQDESVWDWLGARFPVDDERDGKRDESAERSPYRGLAPFSREDAALFFGREREVAAFINRLLVVPLAVVVAPSGAGKSSFVHAGVVPALPANTQIVTVRPGGAPLATLAAVLEAAGIAVGDLEDALRRDRGALGAALRHAAETSGHPIVLVVDQLEELFTLCRHAEEQQLYAEGLAEVARAAEDPVRLVLTLRDDFLVRANQLDAFRDRLALGLELLATPQHDDLLRILVEPAKRAGFTFEDDELAEEMVRAISDQPGALALLSFAASRLWELRDRHFKVLLRRAYVAMGGVGGALAQHAEATLEKMVPEQRSLVRDAFRVLVTAEGTRAVVGRSDLIHVLGGGTLAETLVEKLVSARLLTVLESDGGVNHVEVIHEALLSAWPRLVTWRREDAEGARLRDQLRSAARQWEDRGRPKGLLWRADALDEYRLWRSRYPGTLTRGEEAFAAASLADAARGRTIRRVTVAAVIVGLSGALSAALYMNGRTREQEHIAQRRAVEARDRLAANYEDLGRQLLLAGDSVHAMVYLDEAYRLGATGPALQLLLTLTSRPIEAELFSLEGHQGKLWTAAYSPDGTRVLTASEDRSARIWNAATGALQLGLDGHHATVRSARWSADGKRIATASLDGTAGVWDATTGTRLATLEIPVATELYSVEWSADATRVVTAGADGVARIWNANTGALIASTAGGGSLNFACFDHGGTRIVTAGTPGTNGIWDANTGKLVAALEGHKIRVVAASYSTDGGRIVTASWDGTSTIWDANSGKSLVTLRGHSEMVDDASFSPDGTQVVTGSRDRTARLWNASTGELVASLDGHAGFVYAARFSPDGKRIVTAGGDGRTKIWSKTGALLASLDGHTSAIYSAVFSPDGKHVLTSSWDQTARVWDPDRSIRLAYFEHEGRINSGSFSSDGKRVATASADRTAKIWDPRTGQLLASLAGHRGEVTSVAFSRDGHLVATASDDNTGKLWSSDGRELHTLEGHTKPIYGVAFDASGSYVITASDDTTARVWSTVDGHAVQVLAGHSEPLTWAGFSVDGARAATASADKTARLWDVATGRTIAVLHHDDVVWQGAFSPDGRYLATAGYDKLAKLWDASTGVAIATLAGHTGVVDWIAFDATGRRLVTGSEDATAKVWEVPSGKLLGSLDGHISFVRYASFSSDGHILLTGSYDHTAKLWDADDFRLLASLDGHRAPIFSAEMSSDNSRVLTTSWDGTAMIWDIARDLRTQSRVAEFVRCRIPFVLQDGKILPQPITRSGCPHVR